MLHFLIVEIAKVPLSSDGWGLRLQALLASGRWGVHSKDPRITPLWLRGCLYVSLLIIASC